MEYGIQRRTVILVPPTDDDLIWMFQQFDVPEVYEMFGFHRPSQTRIMRAFRTGDLIVGIIHRVEGRRRVGFIVLFPPTPEADFWEFGYAIPELSDRDAFSALNATDAMAHYALDHLRIERIGWRTREDNRAAAAIVRRLGYRAGETRVVDGHRYTFSILDRETWASRKARLERGEAEHPSGIGAAFATLSPPYAPLRTLGG